MPLDALKNLPPIQDVLGHSSVMPLVSEHGRELVLSWIREALQNARQLILGWSDNPQTSCEHESNPLDRSGWTELMVEHVAQQARAAGQQQLSRVINATGVVVHTGLGRAPLSFAARQALVELGGHCNVEVDLETSERRYRGHRSSESRTILEAVRPRVRSEPEY